MLSQLSLESCLIIFRLLSTKFCKKCQQRKLFDEFYRVTNGISNTEYLRQYCKQCWSKHENKRHATYRAENPLYWSKLLKRSNQKTRVEVLSHYANGTPTCQCCGEQELVFLTLDHINNDGNIHRAFLQAQRGTKSVFGIAMYRWARKQGYPPIFQVLCWNCNWAKRFGPCPHTASRSSPRELKQGALSLW